MTAVKEVDVWVVRWVMAKKSSVVVWWWDETETRTGAEVCTPHRCLVQHVERAAHQHQLRFLAARHQRKHRRVRCPDCARDAPVDVADLRELRADKVASVDG